MNKCEACSKKQTTCCERNHVEICVTPGDIGRIAVHVGSRDFYHLRPVREDMKTVYENPENVRAGGELYVQHLFDADGRRNILKKKDDETCLFLEKAGCRLPLEVRPLVCRLYPYDWNDAREIWLDDSYCPPGHFQDEDEMRDSICVPEAEARRLVALLYEEIMAR